MAEILVSELTYQQRKMRNARRISKTVNLLECCLHHATELLASHHNHGLPDRTSAFIVRVLAYGSVLKDQGNNLPAGKIPTLLLTMKEYQLIETTVKKSRFSFQAEEEDGAMRSILETKLREGMTENVKSENLIVKGKELELYALSDIMREQCDSEFGVPPVSKDFVKNVFRNEVIGSLRSSWERTPGGSWTTSEEFEMVPVALMGSSIWVEVLVMLVWVLLTVHNWALLNQQQHERHASRRSPWIMIDKGKRSLMYLQKELRKAKKVHNALMARLWKEMNLLLAYATSWKGMAHLGSAVALIFLLCNMVYFRVFMTDLHFQSTKRKRRRIKEALTELIAAREKIEARVKTVSVTLVEAMKGKSKDSQKISKSAAQILEHWSTPPRHTRRKSSVVRNKSFRKRK
eukprot:gene20901-25068_t